MSVSNQIPAAVVKAVSELGLTALGDVWHALPGGRTNRVWKIAARNGALICKLYGRDQANPLYPNLPGAEYEALKALGQHDLAPFPVALVRSEVGEILVYHHLEGTTAHLPKAEEIAGLLSRLHRLDVEIPLRRLSSGSKALVRQIREIVGQCHEPRRFPSSPWCSEDVDEVQTPSLVHTDVVASNIVATNAGLRLIDWQCPAIGDACEDLASLLSPAMQYLYAREPQGDGYARRFLAAYPDRATVRRYRLLAPLFHWRIAAYCQWKSDRGSTEYGRAMELELAALERNPKSGNRFSE